MNNSGLLWQGALSQILRWSRWWMMSIRTWTSPSQTSITNNSQMTLCSDRILSSIRPTITVLMSKMPPLKRSRLLVVSDLTGPDSPPTELIRYRPSWPHSRWRTNAIQNSWPFILSDFWHALFLSMTIVSERPLVAFTAFHTDNSIFFNSYLLKLNSFKQSNISVCAIFFFN